MGCGDLHLDSKYAVWLVHVLTLVCLSCTGPLLVLDVSLSPYLEYLACVSVDLDACVHVLAFAQKPDTMRWCKLS